METEIAKISNMQDPNPSLVDSLILGMVLTQYS